MTRTITDIVAVTILLGTVGYFLFNSVERKEGLEVQIDVEMPQKEINIIEFLNQRNDERVNLLRKGCDLDRRQR